MDVAFDNISSLFIFASIFLIVYALLLNIYFISKNGFRVSVNCWFCNKNSKVLYADRNSFVCPFCYQYNGFNKDGDYNKIIDAQSNLSLNTSNTAFYKHSETIPSKIMSNGLCNTCNNNQQLKILQLAKYEPLSEKNYNSEIEHFEKQIEKTYKLCKTCDRILKNTIRKQNAWIFGDKLRNLRTLKNKGLSFLKLKEHSQGNSEDTYFNFKFSVVSFFLLIISILNLLSVCGIDILVFKDILPESLLPNNVIFSNIYSTVYSFIVHNFAKSDYLKYLPKNIKTKESEVFGISIIGFCLEIFKSSEDKKYNNFQKSNRLLSWSILGIISTLDFNLIISSYLNALQILCAIYLIYNYSVMCLKFKKYQAKKYNLKLFKRHSEEIDDDLNNEDSSTESLNDTKFTYRTAINKRSPITAKYPRDILNRTFDPIGSIKDTVTFNNRNTKNYNNGNIELNKHFHSLNLGVVEPPRPMSCQSTSVNPFCTVSRSQSPNSLFNFQLGENTVNNSFSRSYVCPSGSIFKLQNSNNLNNLSFSTQPHVTFNKTVHNEEHQHQPSNYNPENVSFNGTIHNSEPFVSPYNKSSEDFWPRDTSSVLSYNFNRSPPASPKNIDFSQKNPGCFLNSFKPVSPSSPVINSNRSFLLPAKLNNANSISKENENFNFSFQTGSIATSNTWPKNNGSTISQRFVVNSLANTQGHANESVNVKYKNFPISRSSSSSSGFASNGDFAKAQSLPNSRDHSPDRNSMLSEPVFHHKFD